MDALRSQDMSLYEAALSSECPPQLLKMSPSTFKSMVESIFDVLIEHQQAATLWVKLPREKVWQTPVQSYCQQVESTQPIYIVKTRKEEAIDKDEHLEETSSKSSFESKSVSPPSGSPSLTSQHSGSASSSNHHDGNGSGLNRDLSAAFPGVELWLPSDSRLRREFFILVIAPDFQALVLAHRSRSARQPSGSIDSSKSPQSGPSSTVTAEDGAERKPPLLGFCSFNPHSIRVVLNAIGESVRLGHASSPETQTQVETQLQQWQAMLEHRQDSGTSLPLIENVLSRHLRHQEELWRNSSTVRKQADKATDLQLRNEELLNSIRLKDEFFKTVGQELRTPLASMKTALSLLNSPNIKSNQRQRYMDLLTQECDRQGALITSVLELVQLENVDDQATLQPIHLMDIIPGVVSTYQPLAQEKGVMLAYTVPEELPTVASLNSWLRQIIINLLHNAIKFTPEGGRVWVKAKQQGEYIQIEVRDTGIGIAASDIPKIFNRFYRVRPVSGEDSGGAGLGLSIVQQLLLRCGGSVSVHSRQGEGATFNVLMPIYQEEEDNP